MVEWVVKAGAYSLNAGGVRKFDVADSPEVCFSMRSDAEEIYREGSKEKVHKLTGHVTVTVDRDDANEAIKFVAEEVLWWYSQALTFSHGHHVFFHDFRAYEQGKEEEPPSGAVRYLSMRVGPRKGMGAVVETPWKIPDYLKVVIPKLRDDTVREQTGIGLAILWHNEPLMNPAMTVETEFICYWLALETLANAHAKSQGKTAILAKPQFRKVRKAIEDLLKRQFPDAGKLIEQLGTLNYLPVREKVARLLTRYDLPLYKHEFNRFKDWRNDLMHGQLPKDYEAFSKDHRRILRLVEKVILKSLEIYDEQYLHHSLANQDLRAR